MCVRLAPCSPDFVPIKMSLHFGNSVEEIFVQSGIQIHAYWITFFQMFQTEKGLARNFSNALLQFLTDICFFHQVHTYPAIQDYIHITEFNHPHFAPANQPPFIDSITSQKFWFLIWRFNRVLNPITPYVKYSFIVY